MHIAPSSTSETSANALGIFQPPAESPQPHPAHRAVPVPPVPRASLPPGFGVVSASQVLMKRG